MSADEISTDAETVSPCPFTLCEAMRATARRFPRAGVVLLWAECRAALAMCRWLVPDRRFVLRGRDVILLAEDGT